MPFTPDTSVKTLQTHFQERLKRLENNFDNVPNKTEHKTGVPAITASDTQNQLVCDLYSTLINIVDKSQEKNTITDTAEIDQHDQRMSVLIDSLNEQIQQLKNDNDIWSYLLKEGRDAIYYSYLINSITPEKQSICWTLLKALASQNASATEIQILEYLKSNIYISDDSMQTNLLNDDNPYIKYLHVYATNLIISDQCIASAKNLVDKTKHSIPNFVIRLIGAYFLQAIALIQINKSRDSLFVPKQIKAIAEIGLFPKIFKNLEINNWTDALSMGLNIDVYLKYFKKNCGCFLQYDHCFLTQINARVQEANIILFDRVQSTEKHSTDALLNTLKCSSDFLIANGLTSPSSEYFFLFWKSIVRIQLHFNTSSAVQKQYLSAHSMLSFLEKVMAINLTSKDWENDAREILRSLRDKKYNFYNLTLSFLKGIDINMPDTIKTHYISNIYNIKRKIHTFSHNEHSDRIISEIHDILFKISAILEFDQNTLDFLRLIFDWKDKKDNTYKLVLKKRFAPLSQFLPQEQKANNLENIFCPSAYFSSIENYFFFYLVSLTPFIEKFNFNRPELKPYPEKVEVDHRNDKLCSLHEKIMHLIKIARKKDDNLNLYFHILYETTEQIYEIIKELRTNAYLLWREFLTRTGSRHALYLFLFNQLINKKADINIIHHCLRDLFFTCQPPDKTDLANECIQETELLIYLEFIANDRLGHTELTRDQMNNRLVRAHLFFEKSEKYKSIWKSFKIEDFTKKRLNFNKKIPFCLTEFVRASFATEFLNARMRNNISTKKELKFFSDDIDKLTDAGYFSSFMKNANEDKIHSFVNTANNLIQNLLLLSRSYSLNSALDATLIDEKIASLVFSIAQISEKLTQQDYKNIYSKVLLSIYHTFVKNYLMHEFHLKLPKQEMDRLFNAFKTIFFMAHPIDKYDIDLYLVTLNKKNQTDEAILVLSHYLDHPDNAALNKDPYIAIQSALKFGDDCFKKYFPKFDIDSNHDEEIATWINVISNNIKDKLYHFNSLKNDVLNKQFKLFTSHFFIDLTEELHILEMHRDSLQLLINDENFLLFQYAVVKLLNSFNVDTKSIEKVKAVLLYDSQHPFFKSIDESLFDIPDKETIKKCAEKKAHTGKVMVAISENKTEPVSVKKSKKNKNNSQPVPLITNLAEEQAPVMPQQAVDAAPIPEEQMVVHTITPTADTPAPEVPQQLTDAAPIQQDQAVVNIITPPADTPALAESLMSHALFKPADTENKDSIKNVLLDSVTMTITKNDLPPLLLEFIKRLRHEVKKDLYLTGGAVIDLINANDYDCFMLDMNPYDLFRIIHNLNYEVEFIPSKQGMLNTVHIIVQHCDMLAMVTEPDPQNLDALPIQSEAAYIFTPTGLFYINKPKNCCINLSVSSEKYHHLYREMRPTQQPVTLSEKQIQSIKSITQHAHVRSLNLDISCHATNGKSLDTVFIENLKNRDFKLAALGVKLDPDAEQLVVRGVPGAVHSVQNGLISAVDLSTIFIDVTQFFRLIKIHHKHPTFELDEDLKKIKENPEVINSYFMNALFSENKKNNILHFRQVATKLDQFFNKYKADWLIKMFCDYSMIESMTGLKNSNDIVKSAPCLNNYMESVNASDHSRKIIFFYFIYMHACFSGNEKNLNKEFVENFKKIFLEKSEVETFENHLSYIRTRATSTMLPIGTVHRTSKIKPNEKFENMMIDIGLHYFNKKLNMNVKPVMQPTSTPLVLN